MTWQTRLYTPYNIIKQEKRKKNGEGTEKKRGDEAQKKGEKTWEQFEQQQQSHKCSVTFNSNR